MKKLQNCPANPYECDMGELGKEIYAQVVNSNLPKEVKDGWLQVCVENNVDKLY